MGNKQGKLTKAHMALIDEEKKNDQIIRNKLVADHEDQQKIFKLLLLGAGESGKSTLFKQIQTIYGDNLSPEDLKSCKGFVFQNIVQAMHDLAIHTEDCEVEVHQDNRVAQEFYRSVNTDGFEFTEEHYDYAKKLWQDPAIQAVWKCRELFHIPPSAEHFFNRLDIVNAPDYIPSHEDYLRIRVRTTGIVQKQFEIDKNKFRMFDVGGQRNERKKWIHCFQGCTAVLFVAAISEYDQLLFEDDRTNRLVESIKLFDEMVNNKWFAQTSMLLFLNKNDLFEEKIRRVPLRKFFPKYSGNDGDVEGAKNWILQQFLQKNKNPSKVVYSHVTCATNQDNVRAVFQAVKDILIRAALGDAGLLN